MPANPEPTPTHSSRQPIALTKTGSIAASLATVLFLGAWITRGAIERKVPTIFEIAFAITTATSLLVDPRSAVHLPEKLLKTIADSNEEGQ